MQRKYWRENTKEILEGKYKGNIGGQNTKDGSETTKEILEGNYKGNIGGKIQRKYWRAKYKGRK